MAQTLLCDWGRDPVTSLWVNRNQTTLAAADGDIIRTTEGESPTTRGITTSPSIDLNFGPLYRPPGTPSGVAGKGAAQFSAGNFRHGVLANLGGAGVGPTSLGTLDDLINNNAGTVMLVFAAEADSVSGNPGTTNSGMRLLEDAGLNFALRHFTNAGVQQAYAINNDGVAAVIGPVNFAKYTPQLLTWRHHSGSQYLSINGGTELSASNGNTSSLTSNVYFAVSIIYGGYFTGKFYKALAWDTGDADGNLASEQADVLSEFGIGGGGGETAHVFAF